RQARHRFTCTIGQAEAVAGGRPLRLAYADPPYPGKAWLYRDHPDYGGEVDPAQLIPRLSTYDGRAPSPPAAPLPPPPPLCPAGAAGRRGARGRPPAGALAAAQRVGAVHLPAGPAGRPVEPADPTRRLPRARRVADDHPPGPGGRHQTRRVLPLDLHPARRPT